MSACLLIVKAGGLGYPYRMRYVLIITSQKLTASGLARSVPDMTVQTSSDPDIFWLAYRRRSYDIRFEHMGHDFADWADEPEYLHLIDSLGRDAGVYAVHYKQVRTLRDVIFGLAANIHFMIDDDFGLFVSAAEFRRLCETNGDNDAWWLDGQTAS